MDDEFIVKHVSSVIPETTPVRSKEKNKKHKRDQRDEAGHHFQSLARAVELAHEILEQNNSPFRFCVYQEGGEVFIDLALLGDDGKIKEIKKKNITHEEFSIWIERIENGDGLFLDSVL